MEEYKDRTPGFTVTEPIVKITSKDQPFKVGNLPGTAITGFIDVEKFVTLNKQTFFLEKKLPFQILIISAHEHCDHDDHCPPCPPHLSYSCKS
jgi:hypothetical protein